MKASVPWLATAAMAAAAALLWLNLQERDHYETGSRDPVDGTEESAHDLSRLLPPAYPHGDCSHALEVVEQRRTLTLRDRDGWYRLFWAGDEIYHYKEVVHLAADLQNATAVEPAGTWTIKLRAAAAPCGTSPIPETTLVYRLQVSEGFELAQGTLEPPWWPERWPALTYNCLGSHLPSMLSFAWVLAK